VRAHRVATSPRHSDGGHGETKGEAKGMLGSVRGDVGEHAEDRWQARRSRARRRCDGSVLGEACVRVGRRLVARTGQHGVARQGQGRAVCRQARACGVRVGGVCVCVWPNGVSLCACKRDAARRGHDGAAWLGEAVAHRQGWATAWPVRLCTLASSRHGGTATATRSGKSGWATGFVRGNGDRLLQARLGRES
jgi:hypothetical protein